MIADMINNKKLDLIVIELFIRGRKLNVSVVFIRQSISKINITKSINKIIIYHIHII